MKLRIPLIIATTIFFFTGCKSKRVQGLSGVASTTQSAYPPFKSAVTFIVKPYCKIDTLPFTLGVGPAKSIDTIMYDINGMSFYSKGEYFKENSNCEQGQKIGELAGQKTRLYHKSASDQDDPRPLEWKKVVIDGKNINEIEASYFVSRGSRGNEQEKLNLMIRDFGQNKVCLYSRYEKTKYGNGICSNLTYARD